MCTFKLPWGDGCTTRQEWFFCSIVILWNHHHICGPLLTEILLCSAWLYTPQQSCSPFFLYLLKSATKQHSYFEVAIPCDKVMPFRSNHSSNSKEKMAYLSVEMISCLPWYLNFMTRTMRLRRLCCLCPVSKTNSVPARDLEQGRAKTFEVLWWTCEFLSLSIAGGKV